MTGLGWFADNLCKLKFSPIRILLQINKPSVVDPVLSYIPFPSQGFKESL